MRCSIGSSGRSNEIKEIFWFVCKKQREVTMRKICRLLEMVIFKLAPIQKGRIVFTSFNGHYSDSPKYIAKKIKELKPDAEIVWLVDSNSKVDVETVFKTERIDSFKGKYCSATAAIRVDNVFGDCSLMLSPDSFFKNAKRRLVYELQKKNHQKLYTTWHGTPIKRMGRDQIGNNITDFFCNNAVMMLDNQYTLEIMRHITFGKMQMRLLGLPRNDLLFLTDNEKQEIKKKLELPLDKKIVLFAPSFRNDGKDTDQKNVFRSGIDQLNQIDFDKLFATLQARFGGEWVFVCRFHYHVTDLLDWDSLSDKYSGKVINGNRNDDMAEYLACTDVLITDVSSCSFDFTLTKKPCFLFFPDYVHYRDMERGFYCPIEKLPYPFAETFEGLIGAISQFDEELYQANLAKMYEEMGYIKEENAAKRIAEVILQENALL